MIDGLRGRVVRGQNEGDHVIGGSDTPGEKTLTPGLICCPSMIVGPRFTVSGPTLGGTNVNVAAFAAARDDAAGVVAAPATGAAMANGTRTAAAADNLRIRIRISF